MDQAGSFQVRAILFRSRARAEKLINAFPPNRIIENLSEAQTKVLELKDADSEEYYTADLQFQVMEEASSPL